VIDLYVAGEGRRQKRRSETRERKVLEREENLRLGGKARSIPLVEGTIKNVIGLRSENERD